MRRPRSSRLGGVGLSHCAVCPSRRAARNAFARHAGYHDDDDNDDDDDDDDADGDESCSTVQAQQSCPSVDLCDGLAIPVGLVGRVGGTKVVLLWPFVSLGYVLIFGVCVSKVLSFPATAFICMPIFYST